MGNRKKQKPSVAVRLDDELETYLRARAAAGHRSLSGEIRMRLEATQQADQQCIKQKGQQQ